MNSEEYTVETLDRAQLISRYKGYEPILKQSIDIFFEEAPEEMDKLRDSLSEGNTTEAGRAAHSLLNKAGTLQGKRMVSLTRNFEENLRNGEMEEAKAIVPVLETELGKLSSQLRDFQSEL